MSTLTKRLPFGISAAWHGPTGRPVVGAALAAGGGLGMAGVLFPDAGWPGIAAAGLLALAAARLGIAGLLAGAVLGCVLLHIAVYRGGAEPRGPAGATAVATLLLVAAYLAVLQAAAGRANAGLRRALEQQRRLCDSQSRAAHGEGIRCAVRTVQDRINNPLMVIVGNAELLRARGVDLPPDVSHALDHITEAAFRVAEVNRRLCTADQMPTLRTPVGDVLDLDGTMSALTPSPAAGEGSPLRQDSPLPLRERGRGGGRAGRGGRRAGCSAKLCRGVRGCRRCRAPWPPGPRGRRPAPLAGRPPHSTVCLALCGVGVGGLIRPVRQVRWHRRRPVTRHALPYLSRASSTSAAICARRASGLGNFRSERSRSRKSRASACP